MLAIPACVIIAIKNGIVKIHFFAIETRDETEILTIKRPEWTSSAEAWNWAARARCSDHKKSRIGGGKYHCEGSTIRESHNKFKPPPNTFSRQPQVKSISLCNSPCNFNVWMTLSFVYPWSTPGHLQEFISQVNWLILLGFYIHYDPMDLWNSSQNLFGTAHRCMFSKKLVGYGVSTSA